MPKFIIKAKEVHIAEHEVEAENEDEALRMFEEGETDETNFYYDETLDYSVHSEDDEELVSVF